MSLNVGVFNLDGREKNTTILPEVFNSAYRPDVIHKVCVNMSSHRFQRQGRIQQQAKWLVPSPVTLV